MNDDLSRGAYAPIEMGAKAWSSSATSGAKPAESPQPELKVGLTAVVLSVRKEQPVVLVVGAGRSWDAQDVWHLPTGGFCPLMQPSLEAALRDVVGRAAGRELGFLEQLLTDYRSVDGSGGLSGAALSSPRGEADASQLSVSYLALARTDAAPLAVGANWLDIYDLLPWEDFRAGKPQVLVDRILPELEAWAGRDGGADGDGDADGDGRFGEGETAGSRDERFQIAFGVGGRSWDDQHVVDRLDLIVEAGLALPEPRAGLSPSHLRLVAAALGRLRGKIRYRPVVFELLPPEFTLFELQRTVEAVLGPTLHKQNFRRLVEGTGLVEPTGDIRNNTGGRPAKTFRFRREVLLERPAPGVHVRPGRAA